MKKHLLLNCLAIVALLGSCKKEDTVENNNTAIEGSYKFKYLTASTNSTVTNGDEEIVTISDYTTINNNGTITFANSTFTAIDLTYKAEIDAKYYIYSDGELVDSSSYPFTTTLPPSTSVAQYQLVGADSIYFPNGSITINAGSMGSIPTGPSGGRYSINGNLLTITQQFSKDSSFTDSGDILYQKSRAVSSVVLEKQ